jgi:hypothetical protein
MVAALVLPGGSVKLRSPLRVAYLFSDLPYRVFDVWLLPGYVFRYCAGLVCILLPVLDER